MTVDANTLVMIVALTIAIALALASALSWQAARQGPRRRLSGDIEASRARADELVRRRDAGEITQEDFDAQQGLIAGELLARAPSAQAAAAPSPRVPRPGRLALAALVVAAAAGALYAWMGRSTGVFAPSPASTVPAAAASQPARAAHALTDEQLEHMVAQSRQRVQEAPQDAAAWAMLAHSYDMLGKFAESSKAYAALARLMPRDAQVLADYADALAVANGRTLEGEPAALLRKALEIDPRNVKALALAGSAAMERGDFDEAIARWQAARDLVKDPQFASQLDASLAAARASAKGLPAPVRAAASAPALPAAGAIVSGRITLAEDLQSKAPADATLFVFARPVDGSRMPVAILRRHVRDLPLEFSLDDSMAMVPGTRLSKVSSVVIGARISKRGDVAPEAGDMQGLTAPVSVGTRGVKLEISEVLK